MLESTTQEISLRGKYLLIIEDLERDNNSWNYTKGIIKRISDDKIIFEIERNYSNFNHKFFIKDNEEWLFTGKTYMSQCFINLDKEICYDNSSELKLTEEYKKGQSFCWSNIFLSPDEKTLAVHGCYWAYPYEYKFFDFSDPSKGWPLLECDIDTNSQNDEYSYWSKDHIFSFSETHEKIYVNDKWENKMTIFRKNGGFSEDDLCVNIPERTVYLLRKDNKMILVSKLKSKERRDNDKKIKEFWKKEEETKDNHLNNSEIYKYLKENYEINTYWSGAGESLTLNINVKNLKISWTVHKLDEIIINENKYSYSLETVKQCLKV